MKKKIAIVTKKMILGGIEKALLSMLSEINKDKYDITLFLEEKGGELEESIPSWVKVEYIFDDCKSIRENIVISLKKFKIRDAIKFIYSGIRIYILKDEYKIYKDRCSILSKRKEKYDIAISYHNPINLSTIYVIDKLNADKKVMWIHTDINKKILGVDNLAHTLKIEIVKGDGLVLKFKNPFIITYTKEEDGFIYDNDELGIYLYGKNLNELKEDFDENVIVAWKLYVDCDESELNSGAIKLRNKLKELIEEV